MDLNESAQSLRRSRLKEILSWVWGNDVQSCSTCHGPMSVDFNGRPFCRMCRSRVTIIVHNINMEHHRESN